ncbi:hypothetical protein ACHAXT_005720 [Thalassiosira profunda]
MSKRRKICNGAGRAAQLMDLPDAALAHAAGYLALPSRTIFALAVEGQGEDLQKKILSNTKWTALDFSSVEKSLASRLTDDDIEQILLLIDAATNLKALNLAGCVNVTGVCLKMFRSSTELEQLDISLVGQHVRRFGCSYQPPNYTGRPPPGPRLSEAKVLPYLNSIILTGGTSLKLLVIPEKWCKDPGGDLCRFLRRYNAYLKRRGCTCSSCGERLREWERDVNYRSDFASYLGYHYNICYTCSKHFCNGCKSKKLKHCSATMRVHCTECAPRGA